jgi:hypothetical protein
VTEYEEHTDGFTAIEDRFAGYEVYDRAGEKIGKVDDLFVDAAEHPEYIGVKMGFLGTRSTLIPWQAVSSTDDEAKTITVATDKGAAKNGPTFDDDMEITPELRVRSTPTMASSAPLRMRRATPTATTTPRRPPRARE